MLRICTTLVLLLASLPVWAEIAGPVRVIDADTFDVGAVRVRLHAIDAPELDQMCVTAHDGAPFACGKWASTQVAARFAGKTARCTQTDTDRYGRAVATCKVAGQDVGQEIVAQGWAFAYRRYGMDYDLDEKSAHIANRGLHRFRVQSPAQFRQNRTQGSVPRDPSCQIKGNISKNGHIFHVPGQEFYQQTGINTDRGERWFCSAAEARAAGWRAARR